MTTLNPAAPPDGRRVRAALLHKVCGDEDMVALGGAVARVVQMATSEHRGTHDLAHYVLSDVALTQRFLHPANTVRYRTAAGTSVTTVARAISLPGFDNVRTVALAMLLVDALAGSDHAYSVRVELEAALCASLVGREMARHSFWQGAEEASIGALFKNLGALLVASHEHDRYREIQALLAAGKHTPAQAAQMILGCSFDAQSEAVLGEWNIPDVVMRAQRPLDAGVPKLAVNRGEWMCQVASFSFDVARVQEGFAFPLAVGREKCALDLFCLAMENDADLVISDARSAKIRDLLPAWHKALLPDAQSFIARPLVVGKLQRGLFHADRTALAREGVPPDETVLIKALKGQVLAVLAP